MNEFVISFLSVTKYFNGRDLRKGGEMPITRSREIWPLIACGAIFRKTMARYHGVHSLQMLHILCDHCTAHCFFLFLYNHEITDESWSSLKVRVSEATRVAISSRRAETKYNPARGRLGHSSVPHRTVRPAACQRYVTPYLTQDKLEESTLK